MQPRLVAYKLQYGVPGKARRLKTARAADVVRTIRCISLGGNVCRIGRRPRFVPTYRKGKLVAYLDLSDAFSHSGALPVPAPADFQLGDFALADLQPIVPEIAGFDHAEWAVIARARSDGPETLHEPRRSRLARLLFGPPRSYALAGARLEALRQLRVEAWRQPRRMSLPTLGAFISVGFSSAQLALLLSTTGALPVMAKLVSASLKLALPNAAPRNSH